MKLLIVFFLITTSLAGNILFLAPIGPKSHKIFYMAIAETLAKRGHQITMVSAYEPFRKIRNITEIQIEIDITTPLSEAFEGQERAMKSMFMKGPAWCSDTLSQMPVQNLKKRSFDLIILSMVFSDCYLSFIYHFKVPFINILPAGLIGPYHSMAQNIDFPSLSPNKLIVPAEFPQTFMHRLLTITLNGVMDAGYKFYLTPKIENIARERGLIPEDMPSFAEIQKNVSLVVMNSVRAFEWPPRPMMPNIIYAGGAHIRPPQKLNKELQDWVEGAGEDGFIFFSLGSAMKPSSLPEEYRQILVKVFGSLKQRVLWKWNEDTMPGLPKNVKLSKWLPQQDILGHPKLQLFITHGGYSSTLEATYNGIAVLGMPIFADQFSNMKEAKRQGWGRVFHWKELEENALRNIITETIKDESLKKVSQRRAVLMKDVMIPPDEEAAFWIEYVMRHRGAPHIMSPIRMMSWFEIYNMDVYAVLIVAALGIIFIVWRLFRYFWQTLRKIFKNKKKTE